MKKKILSIAFTGLLAASVLGGGTAYANPSVNNDGANENACTGQHVAFGARDAIGARDFSGVKHKADSINKSVQELMKEDWLFVHCDTVTHP
jgi:hypothetical protein